MAHSSQHDHSGGRPGIGWLDLVVVVACVGALAGMAIPHQQEMGGVARRTEVSALAASVRSAARLGHSLWQAQGGGASLNAARGRVRVLNGYPVPEDLGLLLEEPEEMAFRHSRGRWQHRDLALGHPCGVTYAAPPRAGAEPEVSLQVSGC